tara:strand:+ start:2361 stop:2594 length:234 start_codon:yes stop_codon:yes gene_type:complete
MELTNEIMDALNTMYEAKKKKAIANLSNYLNNPAAIGEHPDIVAECDKLLSDIDDALGKQETLQQLLQQGKQNANKS